MLLLLLLLLFWQEVLSILDFDAITIFFSEAINSENKRIAIICAVLQLNGLKVLQMIEFGD